MSNIIASWIANELGQLGSHVATMPNGLVCSIKCITPAEMAPESTRKGTINIRRSR